jgi:hypothetical protein
MSPGAGVIGIANRAAIGGNVHYVAMSDAPAVRVMRTQRGASPVDA